MRLIKPLLVSLMATTILVGCSNAKTSAVTNTPSTQSATQDTTTSMPITLTSTNTSVPTMSIIESEEQIDVFLENNGECLLPCVWSITPGVTKYSDAQRLFELLGWKGSKAHGYYETGKDIQSFSIVLNVDIFASKEIVEKVKIGVGGKDFLNKVNYFSFENITRTLKKPSDILVFIGVNPGILEPDRTSFDLLLYYENKNTLIEYVGTAVRYGDSYRICPSRPNNESITVDPLSGNVSIYTGVIDKINTLEELVRPFWALPDYYISVEKAFGIGIDDFYELASQNNGNICFDSLLSAWKRK